MSVKILFTTQEFEGLFQLQHEGKEVPRLGQITPKSARDIVGDSSYSDTHISAYEVELPDANNTGKLLQEAKEAGARLEQMRMRTIGMEGNTSGRKE